METSYFDQCYFDSSQFEFDTFNGFSDNLKQVSLSGNKNICVGSIAIDNVTYQGFEHLLKHTKTSNNSFTADDVENDKSHLLEFIQKFNPCKNHCQNDGEKVCSNLHWKDGYCDERCNDYKCLYDGGDWYVMCDLDKQTIVAAC